MFNNSLYFQRTISVLDGFTSVWKTDNAGSASNTVILPYEVAGTYSGTIYWGDGTSSVNSYANRTKIYSAIGTYTITIVGTITGFRFNNGGDRLKLLSITKWGDLRLGNSGNYFHGCANLNLSTVSDVLDLTGTTSFVSLFQGCTALSTVNRINEWNVSNVTSMSGTFQSCSNFNQNVGAWSVNNVTTFQNMFSDATIFNNGGSVDIGSWNIRTAGTVNMNSMFFGSAFNQDISGWNVSNVSVMGGMFAFSSFNQNIGGWTIRTAGVTMNSMFQSNTVFNQDISGWNVSGCTAMNSMFNGATAFNQPLSNWERVGSTLSNVTTMNAMFQSATAFNQNIGSWNIRNVLNMVNFMSGKTSANYSTTNMDALLNGWINNELKPSLATTFGTITRTSASDESRRLMAGTSTTKTVTNAINNGSGLIRITAVGHGLTTGNKCFIKSILGTTEANGLATITVIDADNFDIQSSTFVNTYVSGGTVITQYGWTGLPT
jgi:surface protein